MYLLANDTDLTQFLTIVSDYKCDDDPVIMAFSPAKAVFDSYVFNESFLKETEQGRIFSLSGELKWRRIDYFMRIVYLGKKSAITGLEDYSHEVQSLTSSISEFILWGERTDRTEEWIEQKVPHRFFYPIFEKKYSHGRVALEIENLSNSAGMLKFSRYCRIKEIPGGGYAR